MVNKSVNEVILFFSIPLLMRSPRLRFIAPQPTLRVDHARPETNRSVFQLHLQQDTVIHASN
jgi:hypothetical protein